MVWPIKDWDSAMGREVRWAYRASQRTRPRVAFIHHAGQERAANISMFTNQKKLLCSGLATDHFWKISRVARPLHGDLRDGALDFAKVVGGELERNCSKVFFEARQLGRARDRNNPRFLGQQPGQCDLR